MRIIEHNRERLVLARRPAPGGIFAALILTGIVWLALRHPAFALSPGMALVAALAAGLALLFLLGRGPRLTMDRRTEELTLTRTVGFWPVRLRMPLGTVAGATLQRPARRAPGLRAALMLKTPTGPKEQALSDRFSKGPEPEETVTLINDWLAAG